MIALTDCPPNDQLHRFVLGQLPEADSDSMVTHLTDCPRCQSALDGAQESDDSIVSALRSGREDPDVRQDPHCREAVVKALAALARVEDQDEETSSGQLQMPDSIGEYELVRPLGRGGTSHVFLARHTKLGRNVALKILTGQRFASPQARERFASEMRVVGAVAHAGVVAAHDAREIDGIPVLVTEYIEGVDFAKLVRRTGPLSIADACEIVRQVASALSHIDQQGFVHRDIKPSNIMLSRTGEVKLLDLGLARFQGPASDQSELTASGQTVGTADYIAPEQVTDSRQVDIRADIYSLGCTLFHLLTGQPPFAGPDQQSPFDKMSSHVRQAPPRLADRLPGCPIELARLLDAMLAKSSSARPQTPAEVENRLRRLATDANLPALAETALHRSDRDAVATAPPFTPMPRPAPKWYRRPVKLPLTIGLALLGLITGFFGGTMIRIKAPDGTITQMFAPPGSEITIQSEASDATETSSPTEPAAAVAGATERTGENVRPVTERLQGLWFDASKSLLLVFDQKEMWAVEDDDVALAGSYRLDIRTGFDPGSQDDKSVILSVQNQLDSEGPQPEFRFLVETLTQRHLQLRLDDENEQGRTTLTRLGDLPVDGSPIRMQDLEKFGDWESNEEEARRANEKLARQIAVLQRARQMGPELFAELNESRQKARQSAMAARSMNNLRQLAVALAIYENRYGIIPPSKIIGLPEKNGAAKPTDHPYSWRVAILPIINQQALYDRYRFDQPWDSEANRRLLDEMPEIFHSRLSSPEAPNGMTPYMGLATGKGAMGVDKGVAMKDLENGQAETILLVESDRLIPWTKPEDLYDPPAFPPEATVLYTLADGTTRKARADQIPEVELMSRHGTDSSTEENEE